MNKEYKFSEDWFTRHTIVIDRLIEGLKPSRILEIGSFEGRSTTYFIDKIKDQANAEIICVDSWNKYSELSTTDFDKVEETFISNIQLATQNNTVQVTPIKGSSLEGLCKLILAKTPKFDLVYIDGSHMPIDVFQDAALGFHLLKNSGLIIFDDYKGGNMSPNDDKYQNPKIAIDAFIQAHMNLIESITMNFVINNMPIVVNTAKDTYQCYLRKK